MRKRQAARARGDESDESHTATIERVADSAGDQLEALWDKEWETTLLEAAVKRVKAQTELKQWQIFDLYVLKEWPVREVAKALGVSTGRIYLVKHRVSALVKREVKRLRRFP